MDLSLSSDLDCGLQVKLHDMTVTAVNPARACNVTHLEMKM